MGPSHPWGIDIDLYNNPYSPVGAVADGAVTFTGGDPCCSYGVHVIVDHGYFVTTLYAHLSSVTVVKGQKVFKGEILGNAGCTGYCTGNHLHFELMAAGLAIDPLKYLP